MFGCTTIYHSQWCHVGLPPTLGFKHQQYDANQLNPNLDFPKNTKVSWYLDLGHEDACQNWKGDKYRKQSEIETLFPTTRHTYLDEWLPANPMTGGLHRVLHAFCRHIRMLQCPDLYQCWRTSCKGWLRSLVCATEWLGKTPYACSCLQLYVTHTTATHMPAPLPCFLFLHQHPWRQMWSERSATAPAQARVLHSICSTIFIWFVTCFPRSIAVNNTLKPLKPKFVHYQRASPCIWQLACH